jgi:uracil-DNA glycosylase
MADLSEAGEADTGEKGQLDTQDGLCCGLEKLVPKPKNSAPEYCTYPQYICMKNSICFFIQSCKPFQLRQTVFLSRCRSVDSCETTIVAMKNHSPESLPYRADCRECPRLAGFLDTVRARHPDYFNLPVAPFGDMQARILIVGLAPGLHGANRFGRPFTGDRCSNFLYSALHRAGLGSAPRSIARDDGLVLRDLRITNAVKCLPPENKPTLQEIRTCNRFLAAELAQSAQLKGILTLGHISHRAVLEAYGYKATAFKFEMGACHRLPNGIALWNCYHVSPLNTNTGRLSAARFDALLTQIKAAPD